MDEALLLLTDGEVLAGQLTAARERMNEASGRPAGAYLEDEEDWD